MKVARNEVGKGSKQEEHGANVSRALRRKAKANTAQIMQEPVNRGK